MIGFGPVRGIEKVQAYLRKVPRGAMKVAIPAITEYIIGDGSHGLSHDDPYKQTTRKAVYGGGHGTFSNGNPLPDGFYSEKQFGYVMAAIKSGEIVLGKRRNNPTASSQGYTTKITRGGYGATIENSEPSTFWARKWGGWKNWRSYTKVVEDNIKGALKHATTAVNAFLRSK